MKINFLVLNGLLFSYALLANNVLTNLKTEKVKVIFFQSSMLLDSIGTLNILRENEYLVDSLHWWSSKDGICYKPKIDEKEYILFSLTFITKINFEGMNINIIINIITECIYPLR